MLPEGRKHAAQRWHTVDTKRERLLLAQAMPAIGGQVRAGDPCGFTMHEERIRMGDFVRLARTADRDPRRCGSIRNQRPGTRQQTPCAVSWSETELSPKHTPLATVLITPTVLAIVQPVLTNV